MLMDQISGSDIFWLPVDIWQLRLTAGITALDGNLIGWWVVWDYGVSI